MYYHQLDDAKKSMTDDERIFYIEGIAKLKGEPPCPKWLRGQLGEDAFSTLARAYVFRPHDQEQTVCDVGGLSDLKVLEITGWSNLEELKGLENLQQLERITVSCGSLKGYESISKLKSLRSAGLHSCKNLTELPFKEMPELEGLSISDTPNLLQYTGLGRLPKLKTVHLNKVVSLDFSTIQPNQISTLTIRMCHSEKEIKGLDKFQSLEKLIIISCRELEGIANIGKLHRLKTLSMSLSAVMDFSSLANLTNLKELYLSDNAGLTNLDFAKGLNQLEMLQLQRCENLTDWEGVLGLRQLKLLNVTGCKNITKSDVQLLQKQLPTTEVKAYFPE